jgi:hypothetical protein
VSVGQSNKEDEYVARQWNLNLDGDEGMKATLAEARKAGHSRLFALAYDSESLAQWHSRPDEAAMKQFLDSRDESESMVFNCAVAIVVVNPQDTDETIEAMIASRQERRGSGPGYFDESF